MTSPPKTTNKSKRPRLSLQIQSACITPSKEFRRQSMDPSDQTTFNTMSNVYVTASERLSAEKPSESIGAIDARHSLDRLKTSVEKINPDSSFDSDSRSTVVTPFVQTCPDTPLTAPLTSAQRRDFVYPSTITATPPLSAGALDDASKIFTFSLADTSSPRSCPSSRAPADDGTPSRRRASLPFSEMPPCRMPYTHPRSLHSILRNSPLPSTSATPPPSSPKHQLLRCQEKAVKKVEYDSPLEQEITTFKYTKSHSDLLAEDGSPLSASDGAPFAVAEPQITTLDMGLSFTPSEIQDGGQTPGPFEDMRRKMVGLAAASPMPPGLAANPCANRKRKRREKKRQWIWTIGQEEDDEDVGGAIITLRAQTESQTAADKTVERVDLLATPSVESSSSSSDGSEVEMSDSCSIVSSEDHHQKRWHSVSSNADVASKFCTATEQDSRKTDMPMLKIPERSSDADPPE